MVPLKSAFFQIQINYFWGKLRWRLTENTNLLLFDSFWNKKFRAENLSKSLSRAKKYWKFTSFFNLCVVFNLLPIYIRNFLFRPLTRVKKLREKLTVLLNIHAVSFFLKDLEMCRKTKKILKLESYLKFQQKLSHFQVFFRKIDLWMKI